MQNILPPINLLIFLAAFAMLMIAVTYLRGSGTILKGFTKPRGSTVIGLAVFLFTGMALGVFIVFSLFTGEIGLVGLEFVFDNTYFMIFTIAFVFAFMLMLSYVYIYRGGA